MRRLLATGLGLVLLVGCDAGGDVAEESPVAAGGESALAAAVELSWLPEAAVEVALEQADETQGTVCVYVRQPRDADCAAFEEVLATAQVRALLKDLTIAIRHDVEEATDFTKQHGIESVPTLIFLAADGREVGRIVGASQAAALPRLVGAFGLGRDRLSLQLEDVVRGQLQLAEMLVERRNPPEALATLKRALAALPADPQVANLLAPEVLQELAMLAQFSDGGREMLQARASAAQARLEAGDATVVDIHVLATLAQLTGQQAAFLAQYDEHGEQYGAGEVRTVWVDQLLQPLLDADRIADITAGMDVAAVGLQRLRMAVATKPAKSDYADGDAHWQAMLAWQRALSARVPRYYRVLLRTGQVEAAEELATRVLSLVGNRQMYNALAWQGYLVGKPTATHQEYAQKADEMAAGFDAAIADTLARIMAVRGEPEKAWALIEERMGRTNNEQELAIHRETLAAITEDTGYGGKEE
jgi:tetratricopeptide (TPR) repeat protein